MPRKAAQAGYLYTIQFFSNGKPARYHHATGYLGSTGRDFAVRIAEHKQGEGSPLVRAAIQSGLDARLVGVVPFQSERAARLAESRLKGYHCNRRALKKMKTMPLFVSM